MNILEKFKKVRAINASTKFNKQLNDGIKNGTIKKFDDEFYSKLEGMYFGGIPVYYYLRRMNMKKCYDTSAILALALGKDSKVCRGNLKVQQIVEETPFFGHGWVEKDGLVNDTTWQIICPKSDYYKLMGVQKPIAINQEEFFKNNKISDWTIRNKEYYEKNYVPFHYQLIFQIREIETLVLNSPTQPEEDAKNMPNIALTYSTTEKDKELARKVLNDLPDTSNVKMDIKIM